jgi:RNA recognition motif-containing protein
MNIHVSNLNSETTVQQIAELFAPFGTASNSQVRTIADVSKNHMVTFAYVRMDNRSEGEAAAAKLDRSNFLGNVIQVKEAK